MRKKFLVVAFIASMSAGAQQNKSIYLEAGGPGLLSLNYDMRFTNRDNGWGGRIGVGRIAIDKVGGVVIPANINYLFGKKHHFLEVGAGVTYIAKAFDHNNDHVDDLDSSYHKFFGHASVGYRYQSKSGFQFRANISPLYYDKILPWGGVSVGYCLGSARRIGSASHDVAPSKAVYLEAGGPGILSLNYDTRFSRGRSGWGGRIGAGAVRVKNRIDVNGFKDSKPQMFFPVAFNYLAGEGRHQLELGAGITYATRAKLILNTGTFYPGVFSHLNIGYRLSPVDKGYLFRAAFTPIIVSGKIIPWGGLSFGYKFSHLRSNNKKY